MSTHARWAFAHTHPEKRLVCVEVESVLRLLDSDERSTLREGGVRSGGGMNVIILFPDASEIPLFTPFRPRPGSLNFPERDGGL